MTVRLERVGKRFHRDWVVRDLTASFSSPGRHGIAGPNGSGKTTVMRLISGQLTPSEGVVSYLNDAVTIVPDKRYNWISWAAPYLELIEEFSLEEQLRFHGQLRRMTKSVDEIVSTLDMHAHRTKRLADFSSGMKQRLRIAMALFTESSVVLLDEPSSNLDAEGIQWFQSLLALNEAGRTVIIASNEERDLAACQQRIILSATHRA
jgi:ABC-type multidrug transport system ATPase subunit